MTVIDIAQEFDLSFPTAKSIIEKYLLDDLLKLSEKVSKGSGRKTQQYELNTISVYSIGIKLELDSIEMQLVDLKGNIFNSLTIKESFVNREDIVEDIIIILESFLEKIGQNIKEKLLGIGVSIPGILDTNLLTLKIGTNFNIKDKDLKKIEEKTGHKLFISNEANAGALAEKLIGDGIEKENFNFLSLGTGIGQGKFIKNNLYKGFSNMAGEIGHMEIVLDGKKCNCGGNGCWEMYASEKALIEMFKIEYPKIKSIDEIFKKGYIDSVKGKEILSRYLKYLAIGIRNMLMIEDPEVIIVGGEIARYKEYFIEEMNDKIFTNNLFYRDKNLIQFSRFGKNANLMGASLLPIIETFF